MAALVLGVGLVLARGATLGGFGEEAAILGVTWVDDEAACLGDDVVHGGVAAVSGLGGGSFAAGGAGAGVEVGVDGAVGAGVGAVGAGGAALFVHHLHGCPSVLQFQWERLPKLPGLEKMYLCELRAPFLCWSVYLLSSISPCFAEPAPPLLHLLHVLVVGQVVGVPLLLLGLHSGDLRDLEPRGS